MKNLNFDKVAKIELSTLICVYNNLCDDHNCYDDRIYDMEELNELYSDPWEACRAFYFGYRYNPYATDETKRESSSPCDDYFFYNGYGNICTIQYDSDAVKFICGNMQSMFEESEIMEELAKYIDDESEYSDEAA